MELSYKEISFLLVTDMVDCDIRFDSYRIL
jgi:hypothetical protein